jgi:hypothetical protein
MPQAKPIGCVFLAALLLLGPANAWGQATHAEPVRFTDAPPPAPKHVVIEIRTIKSVGEAYPQFLEDLGQKKCVLLNQDNQDFNQQPLPKLKSGKEQASFTKQTVAQSPCLKLELTAPELRAIIRSIKGAANESIVQSPTVTLVDGHEGSVSAGVKRPFVNLDFDFDRQQVIPSVRVFHEGFQFRVEADIVEGKIQVSGIMELSQIVGVSEVGLPSIAPVSGETKFQVPEVRVDQTQFATTVADGNTLLLIPTSIMETKRRVESKLLRKTKVETVKQRVVYLVTPRVVDSTALKTAQSIR